MLWILGIVAYLLYVRHQRFQRVKEMQASFSLAHRGEKTTTMTPVEAQKIVLKTLSLEIPFTGQKSLEFALFRVSTSSPVALFSLEPID